MSKEELDRKGLKDLLRYLGKILPKIEEKAQALYPKGYLLHWTDWPEDVLTLFPEGDDAIEDIYGYLAGLLIGFGEYFKEAGEAIQLPTPPRAKPQPRSTKKAQPKKAKKAEGVGRKSEAKTKKKK